MAESKGTMLAKSVQKHAGRAKEKILQNLGKVDRTADEIFDDHLNNFNRQQHNANRLQKEFNNYIRCIRAAQTASKSLMDAISEIYEPQWSGYDALQAQAQSAESLWQDFAHKLADQVLIPLNTYTGQFPEMKKKVEKRNRKLIDYDGQRHSFQSLQANANKRKDDVKLTKGREQLEEARRTYELLNTELHDELPALYESRILFLVTNLQTLFATEQVFHNETAKIYSELEAIVDKLATESQRGSNSLRKITANAIKSTSPLQSPVKQMNNANITNSNGNNEYQNTNGTANPPSPRSSSSQESRVDNVSPTPESAAATALKEVNVTGIAKMEIGSTASINLVNDATAAESTAATATTETDKITAQIKNSPNVNTKTTTTLTTTPTSAVEEFSAKGTLATTVSEVNAIAETTAGSTTKENMDVNNTTSAIAATATATATPPVAIKFSADATTGESTKKSEQINGNDNANGNANANTISKITPAIPPMTATTNGNATTASSTGITAPEGLQSNKTNLDATTADLPPGVLYRVKATYGYVKEDVDELSFEVGDIIRVIEYDDPEDQEEGWLMGEKEGTNEKGLFPANFTKPI